MIKNIVNKIKMFALVAPVFAATESIKIEAGDAGTLGNTLSTITVANLITTILSVVFVIVALIFFFMLVVGGVKWISSGGDEKKVAAARASITNALIGLVIVFASWAIVNLLGSIFGFSLTDLKFTKLG